MSKCPSRSDLVSWIVDQGDAALRLRPHLANCPSCRREAAELLECLNLAAELAAFLDAPQEEVPPHLAERMFEAVMAFYQQKFPTPAACPDQLVVLDWLSDPQTVDSATRGHIETCPECLVLSDDLHNIIEHSGQFEAFFAHDRSPGETIPSDVARRLATALQGPWDELMGRASCLSHAQLFSVLFGGSPNSQDRSHLHGCGYCREKVSLLLGALKIAAEYFEIQSLELSAASDPIPTDLAEEALQSVMGVFDEVFPPCPAPKTLAPLAFDDPCPPDVTSHVAECPQCQAAVQQMRSALNDAADFAEFCSPVEDAAVPAMPAHLAERNREKVLEEFDKRFPKLKKLHRPKPSGAGWQPKIIPRFVRIVRSRQLHTIAASLMLVVTGWFLMGADTGNRDQIRDALTSAREAYRAGDLEAARTFVKDADDLLVKYPQHKDLADDADSLLATIGKVESRRREYETRQESIAQGGKALKKSVSDGLVFVREVRDLAPQATGAIGSTFDRLSGLTQSQISDGLAGLQARLEQRSTRKDEPWHMLPDATLRVVYGTFNRRMLTGDGSFRLGRYVDRYFDFSRPKKNAASLFAAHVPGGVPAGENERLDRVGPLFARDDKDAPGADVRQNDGTASTDRVATRRELKPDEVKLPSGSLTGGHVGAGG